MNGQSKNETDKKEEVQIPTFTDEISVQEVAISLPEGCLALDQDRTWHWFFECDIDIKKIGNKKVWVSKSRGRKLPYCIKLSGIDTKWGWKTGVICHGSSSLAENRMKLLELVLQYADKEERQRVYAAIGKNIEEEVVEGMKIIKEQLVNMANGEEGDVFNITDLVGEMPEPEYDNTDDKDDEEGEYDDNFGKESLNESSLNESSLNESSLNESSLEENNVATDTKEDVKEDTKEDIEDSKEVEEKVSINTDMSLEKVPTNVDETDEKEGKKGKNMLNYNTYILNKDNNTFLSIEKASKMDILKKIVEIGTTNVMILIEVNGKWQEVEILE